MMRRYTLGLRGREFVIDVQEIAADRFEVVVGGESYEVTLSGDEHLPEATITPGLLPARAAAEVPASSAGRDRAAPSKAAAPAVAAAARPAAARGNGGNGDAASRGAALSAPMPGVILEVNVKPGDVVQRGQPLLVLEAMKMHNLIGAPKAGTIAEVCVAPGQPVGHGDMLVRYAQG